MCDDSKRLTQETCWLLRVRLKMSASGLFLIITNLKDTHHDQPNQTTKSNVNGNVSHFIDDNERGTPYAAVTVQPNGDYWFTVHGSYSFGRPAHDKILQAVKPTGKNITAENSIKSSLRVINYRSLD